MKNIVERIDHFHASKEESPRDYLGASFIGHFCDRYLWLNYRWAVKEKIDGRMRRLFRRGELEEEVFVEDLFNIGYSVKNRQNEVSISAHIKGHIDGTVTINESEYLVEFKTHNLKSFNDLEKLGVLESKPMHYVQMQTYMRGLGLNNAIYMAVCKNDDRLYVELIPYNKNDAEKYIDRANSIAESDRMPPPISQNPSWYQCTMCKAHSICHKRDRISMPKSCRTCQNLTLKSNSTWFCEWHNRFAPKYSHADACEDYKIHEDLSDAS